MGRTKYNGQGIVATSLGFAGDDDQKRVSGRQKATQLGEIGTAVPEAIRVALTEALSFSQWKATSRPQLCEGAG
jgi:hypothetical protein